jgi:hypothetical protein
LLNIDNGRDKRYNHQQPRKNKPKKHNGANMMKSEGSRDPAAEQESAQLDEIYPEHEFHRDLAHHDVVSHYQRELQAKLGHPVTYCEAEHVAYSLWGTTEELTEKLRQKYASQG